MKSVNILQGLTEVTAKTVSDALRKQYSGEVVSFNLLKEKNSFFISPFKYDSLSEETSCIVFNGVNEKQLTEILRDFDSSKISVRKKGRGEIEISRPDIIINLLADVDVCKMSRLHPEFNAV